MTGDGLLSLRWNNHRSSFLQVLSSLRNKQTYSDITLACGGKFYSVHKFVLSTCSDYFVEILEKTPCKHPIIVLKDIPHEHLEALLNYMYLGEVNVLQTELAGLIKAAECLRIKGLAVPDESPPPHKDEDSQKAFLGAEDESPRRKRNHEEDSNSSSGSPRKKNSYWQDVEESTDKVTDSGNLENIPKDRSPVSHQQMPQTTTEDSFSESSTALHRESQQEKSPLVENPTIKVENEDLKYEEEEEEEGLSVEDTSAALEVQMVESDGSQGSQMNSDMGVRIKYEPPMSSGGGVSASNVSPVAQQYSHHPQSFEEIVSQSIPGPSGIQGQDGGQGWDHSGDMSSFHMRRFPQQEGLATHCNMPQTGQVRSRWGQEGSYGHQPQQHTTVTRDEKAQQAPHSYQSMISPRSISASSTDRAEHQATAADLSTSLDKRFCQICGYKGQDVSQLRKHLRIHTGEKPYQCPLCGYCSAQSSNLKVHMKRHHQEPGQQDSLNSFQHIFNDTVMLE